jgi:hypothetical protein
MKRIGSLIKRFDGRLVQQAPKRADPELLTTQHRQWRLTICQRANWRCEFVDDQGLRCSKAAPHHRLVADHVVERADGGAVLDPANGQCLCIEHNTLKGIHARARRAAG